jgi:hypothetical protein
MISYTDLNSSLRSSNHSSDRSYSVFISTFSNRLVKDSVYIPSSVIAIIEDVKRFVGNLRPFDQTVGLTLVGQLDIVGAIVLLHLLGDPSAITGFVIAVRITPVDSQRVLVTVRQRPIAECLKAMLPFIADPDALGSVFMPTRAVGLGASLPHCEPDVV